MKKVFIFINIILLAFILVSCRDNNDNINDGKGEDEVDKLVVKFNTLGGSEIDDILFEGAIKVDAPAFPKKEGYIFEGWFLDEEYKLPFEFERLVLRDSVTLYAKWRKELTDYNKTFKVLSIGNSFSTDAHGYLWSIAESYGVDPENIIIANMFIGGGPLFNHRHYLETDTPAYTYQKYTSPKLVEINDYYLKDAIIDEEWDVITFQEVSSFSGLYEHIGDTISVLATWAKENALNKDVKIGWHMTWAYQQNATHEGFANYDNDQMKMFEMIVEATHKKVFSNNLINFVIPSGVAIQNARTSYFGDKLTLDGFHLSRPLGRFI